MSRLSKYVCVASAAAAVAFAVFNINGARGRAQSPRLDAGLSRAECWSEAERADARHAFELELEWLAAGLDAQGSDEDWVAIQERRARIRWKVYGDEAGSRAILAELRAHPRGMYAAGMEEARLDAAARRFSGSAQAAERALSAAKTRGERHDARVAVLHARVEWAMQASREGEAYDRTALRASASDVAGMDPASARSLLKTALFLGDGPGALAAWRAYFFIADDQAAPAVLTQSARALNATLPGWTGEEIDPDVRRAIAMTLAASRMFEEAAAVVYGAPPDARANLLEDDALKAILAYRAFCAEVEANLNEQYAMDARGDSQRDGVYGSFEDPLRKLWIALGRDGAAVPVYRGNRDAFGDAIVRALGPEFGSVVRFVEIDGHHGVQMGHVVKDERRTIDQYGRRASVRFVALDSMASNGFASWAWNSGAQHGGWTETDLIVQVRPPYASKPHRVWRTLTWDSDRERRIAHIRRETEADVPRARQNPAGYLPGLAMRLHDQGARRLHDRLQREGLAGDALRLAFVSAYASAVEESSIFAHEGRHFIDRQHRVLPTSSWKKEFTAKLSEVAFAPEPRLALGAIFSSNIGDGGAHGRANAAIMKGIVRWMEGNSAAIDAFDPALPTLVQFDKLADEQIRDAFRAMDPAAR